jgi:hypothetical protein
MQHHQRQKGGTMNATIPVLGISVFAQKFRGFYVEALGNLVP